MAEMGYAVTAVDISNVGIKQIQKQNPAVMAVVSDLYSFDITNYDYILMDSILHFYKNDIEKEETLLRRILSEMKTGSILVNCLMKSNKAEKVLKEIIRQYPTEILQEAYIDYPDFDAVYHMIVVEKCL